MHGILESIILEPNQIYLHQTGTVISMVLMKKNWLVKYMLTCESSLENNLPTIIQHVRSRNQSYDFTGYPRDNQVLIEKQNHAFPLYY